METTSQHPEQTKQLAQKIAATLRGGQILVLKGDLGAGKTTFTQGLGQYFHIKKPITSPTFIGMQIYDIANHGSIKYLCHVDAYRFQSIDDAISAGIDEYLGRNDVLAIIEWPENLFGLLQKEHQTIEFSHLNENSRLIKYQELK